MTIVKVGLHWIFKGSYETKYTKIRHTLSFFKTNLLKTLLKEMYP